MSATEVRMFVLFWSLAACTEKSADTSAKADNDQPDDGWIDADGDGYSPAASELADCDDADAAVHPGAEERCDGRDNDCDGVVPDTEQDADGDGQRACDTDCDDADPLRASGIAEACDGVDNDCDGVVSDDERDDDRDGWRACEGDCDDDDATAHPGAAEACDGVDNDCDGVVPADESDADGDGDGETACAGDCDDADAEAWTGAVERCENGVDDDCDGEADTDCEGCTVILGTGASVQAAIDAAADGDVICLGSGTWTESIDFAGRNVAVVGVGPTRTFLDGGGIARVVQFVSGEGSGAELRALTVQGGYANGEDAGGIWIANSSPTLTNLVVQNNENTGYPALRGGGIFVEGGAPTLTGLIVRDNVALAWSEYHYGHGGGIALANTDAILDGVVLEGNQAGWSGSGLYVEDSSAAIFATIIHDNEYSQAGGGGLVVRGGAPAFENLRVSANFAAEEYGVAYGGGAWLEDTDASFTNAAFVENRTYGGAGSSYGGGIYVHSGEPVFTNVLVYDNMTGDAGGGVYVRSGTPRFLYSDVWGNGPDDWYGLADPTGTDGNLSVDPDLLSGGVHLDASSALIDAGDPSRLDPDGSRSDIGLFGGPYADTFDQDQDGWPGWWLPGPYDTTTSPGMDCDDDDASVYPGSGC